MSERACKIEMSPGGDIALTIPGLGEAGLGHTVYLPATESGLTNLLVILRERAKWPESRIGSPGSPTNWDLIHKQTKAILAERKPKLSPEMDDFLKGFGL